MTTRTRIERLEKALPKDGSCPLCGQQRQDKSDPQYIALIEQAEALLAEVVQETDEDEATARAWLAEHEPTVAELLGIQSPRSCRACGRGPAPTPHEMRTKVEEFVAMLLPDCGGDRAAAVAALKEMAPTLGEYAIL